MNDYIGDAMSDNKNIRIESDSMGKVEVPENVYWGDKHNGLCIILILATILCRAN